jgi:hypothetical protein
MFGRWVESRWKKKLGDGYVVCRYAAPLALTDRVTALPWAGL